MKIYITEPFRIYHSKPNFILVNYIGPARLDIDMWELHLPTLVLASGIKIKSILLSPQEIEELKYIKIE